MASTRLIPDLSTTPLYAAAVMQTRDDPRLLALWCHYALWQPIDTALGQRPDVMTWAERILLTPAEIIQLTSVLVTRGLLTEFEDIPHWGLQEASWQEVSTYSNELRRRAGLTTLQATQEPLFGAASTADAAQEQLTARMSEETATVEITEPA